MGKQPSILKRSMPTRLRSIISVALIGLVWAGAFKLLASDNLPPIRSSDANDVLPVRKLSCTDSFWRDHETCGQHGVNCEPFTNQFVAFQCPADCLRDGVVTGEPHLAGGDEILGRPLVIGGPIYRGDSYICPAAVHAGVVEGAAGGCGVAKFMGMTNSFDSSYMFGVESIGVPTYFPKTFRFTVESDEMRCPAERRTSALLPYLSAASTALVWRAAGSGTVRIVWSLAVICAHLSSSRGAAAGSGSGSGSAWLGSSKTAPAPRAADDDGKRTPVPKVLEPVIHMNSISNFSIKWETPVPSDVDGISMLVDDVERSRHIFGAKDTLPYGETDESFFWQRTPQAFVDFIRFGYVKDGKVLKYSKPGVWFTNGTWTGIPAEI